MRKLLTKNVVTLNALWVTFDGDHQQKELRLSCDPDVVTGTGRRLTDSQLSGISLVLYGDSRKFECSSQTLNVNLLSKPLTRCMVFVDNILVAISNKEDNLYCYLATGKVVDEETLFEICKLAKKESILSKIKSLRSNLEEMMLEYEELEMMTF